jgi:uncharacterized protein
VAPTRTRLVLAALALLVSGYLGVVGWLLWHEVELIFHPVASLAPLSPDLGLEPERIQFRGDSCDDRLVWVFRARRRDPGPWVLFLHGNSANVSSPGNVERCHQLTLLGANVVAVEYPGFGELPGQPSEEALHVAAQDGWHWLTASLGVSPEQVVIYGWSLGSGVATRLAATVPEAGVILEGAFTSVRDRAHEVYPWLPIRWMLRHPFLSSAHIAHLGSPLLLLHARDDTIIPFAHSERLLAAAGGPKQLVPLSGGHIVPNLVAEDAYLQSLATFLGAVIPRAGRDTVPRSLVVPLLGAVEADARHAAVALMDDALAGRRPGVNRAPYALEFAGRHWLDADPAFAATILQANVGAHPRTWSSFVALAEALERVSDEPGAAQARQRAAELRPAS